MSILLALIVFSILVFIHEFGHFLLAKKNGVKVIEFSIGFGPRLFSFDKGETKYSFKVIPFGGACQMLNKDMISEEEMKRIRFLMRRIRFLMRKWKGIRFLKWKWKRRIYPVPLKANQYGQECLLF